MECLQLERETTRKNIFGDKDLQPIIRELIEKGVKNGYRRTDVVKALLSMWNETYSIEVDAYELKDYEVLFFRKTHQFIDDYANLILEEYDRRHPEAERKCGTDELRQAIYLDSMEEFLCAAYFAFCRNGNLTLEGIQNSAKNVLGHECVNPRDCDTIINNVINFRIQYDPSEYKPESNKPVELCSVYDIPSRRKFFKKQAHKSNGLFDGVLSAIWYINQYC